MRNFSLKWSRFLSLPVESMSMKHYHTVENIVRKHLSQLDMHKLMGPDEMSPRVLM